MALAYGRLAICNGYVAINPSQMGRNIPPFLPQLSIIRLRAAAGPSFHSSIFSVLEDVP